MLETIVAESIFDSATGKEKEKRRRWESKDLMQAKRKG